MESRQQEQDRLFAEMPGQNHLSQVIQATEEQRRMLRLQADALEIEVQEKRDAREISIAERLAKAGIFPSVQDVNKAYAIIQMGKVHGLSEAESLQVITLGPQGKPSFDVHWQMAQIRQRGLGDYKILTMTDHECSVQFYRWRQGELQEEGEPVSMTMDGARGIAIYDKQQQERYEKTKDPKDKPSLGGKFLWRTRPMNMLYAFCGRNGCRWFFPEILGGSSNAAQDEQDMIDAGVIQGRHVTNEIAAETIEELSPERTDPTLPTVSASSIAGEPADLLPALNGYESESETYEDDQEATNARETDAEEAKSTHGHSGSFRGVDMQTGEVYESDPEIEEVRIMNDGELRVKLLKKIRDAEGLPKDAPGATLKARTGLIRKARAQLKSPTHVGEKLVSIEAELSTMIADATF